MVATNRKNRKELALFRRRTKRHAVMDVKITIHRILKTEIITEFRNAVGNCILSIAL
jgi:hypothetical protein